MLGDIPVLVASLNYIDTTFDQEEPPQNEWDSRLPPATITIIGETGTLYNLHSALSGEKDHAFSQLCEKYAVEHAESSNWNVFEVVAEELYLRPMLQVSGLLRPEYLTQIHFGFIYARCKLITTFDEANFCSS